MPKDNKYLHIPDEGASYGADSSVIPEAKFILQTMNNIHRGNFYRAFQTDLLKRSYFSVLDNQANK